MSEGNPRSSALSTVLLDALLSLLLTSLDHRIVDDRPRVLRSVILGRLILCGVFGKDGLGVEHAIRAIAALNQRSMAFTEEVWGNAPECHADRGGPVGQLEGVDERALLFFPAPLFDETAQAERLAIG